MKNQNMEIYCIFKENEINFQDLLEKIFIDYLQEKEAN